MKSQSLMWAPWLWSLKRDAVSEGKVNQPGLCIARVEPLLVIFPTHRTLPGIGMSHWEHYVQKLVPAFASFFFPSLPRFLFIAQQLDHKVGLCLGRRLLLLFSHLVVSDSS